MKHYIYGLFFLHVYLILRNPHLFDFEAKISMSCQIKRELNPYSYVYIGNQRERDAKRVLFGNSKSEICECGS